MSAHSRHAMVSVKTVFSGYHYNYKYRLETSEKELCDLYRVDSLKRGGHLDYSYVTENRERVIDVAFLVEMFV